MYKDSSLKLKAVFEKYRCLKGICFNARERAKSDPTNFVRTISLPFPGKEVKNRRKYIANYFDELQKSIFDYSFLDLVAIFEEIVFSKISNASGEIKRIVKDEYSKAPFRESAASFVKDKDDIYNLSGVRKLLEGKIPQEMSADLAGTLEHRNYLAHGKRVGIGKQSTLCNTDELYEILQNILSIINK